jgi:hypothetical protein
MSAWVRDFSCKIKYDILPSPAPSRSHQGTTTWEIESTRHLLWFLVHFLQFITWLLRFHVRFLHPSLMRLPHGRIHTSTMKLLRFLAQFLWFIVWFLRFLVRFFHPSLMYPPHPSQIHTSTRQHENSLSFRFDPSSFIPPLSLVVYSVFSLTYRLIGKNCLIFEKTDWFSIFFFQNLKIKLCTNF